MAAEGGPGGQSGLWRLAWLVLSVVAAFVITVLLVFAFWLVSIEMGWAHMHDRPDLDKWFENLSSKKGLCCSMADGMVVTDPDWDSLDGHYRVNLDGKWIVVPDAAVLTEPNKYGPTLVWPYKNSNGENSIKCFMPGAGG